MYKMEQTLQMFEIILWRTNWYFVPKHPWKINLKLYEKHLDSVLDLSIFCPMRKVHTCTFIQLDFAVVKTENSKLADIS